MMKFLHKTISVIALSILVTHSYSQTTTTAPVNATQAVQVLVGSGVTPSNVQFQGSAQQLASYTSTGTTLPIPQGLIISTGIANNPLLNGNANNFLSDGVNGLTNNPLLSNIAAGNTTDGAILQFDFSPAGDTLKFNYVFGSEEYNDFVDSEFNDAFGFFLSGPNPAGGTYTDFNIALIPGTSSPVSINNVNNGYSFGCSAGPCDNCAYFVDNSCGGSNIAPDAFTVRLTAIAAVVPCAQYTIKLGIADGAGDFGDNAYDSWVFLEANSFTTGAVSIVPDYNFSSALNDTLIYEGCSNVTLSFVRDGQPTTFDTVNVDITGTATNGVDYTAAGGTFPTQIIFAPGQSTVQVTLVPEADNLVEGNETVTFSITNVNLCGDTVVTGLTFIITDVQPMNVDVGPDLTICANVPITVVPVVTGGVPPYQQMHWEHNGSPIGSNLTNYIPPSGGMYIFQATNACDLTETAYDTLMVNIITPQYTITLDADSLSCFGVNDGSIDLTTNGPTPPFEYTWTPGNMHTQDISGLAPGVYSVTVVDNGGCVVTGSAEVFAPANIPINITDKFICSGAPTVINPSPAAGVSYTWSPPQYFTTPTSASPVFAGNNAGPGYDTLTLYVTGTSPGACGVDSFKVYLSPLPQVSLMQPGYDTTALCPNDTLTLTNSASNTGYPNVTTHLWSTGGNSASITTSTPGIYWVELTNAAGCKNRDSLAVVPLFPPAPYIDSVFYICGTQDIAIFGAGYNPPTTIAWSTGSTEDTIMVSTPGTYSLIATNACGSDTVSTQVVQIPSPSPTNIPNAFTPNGDGTNDVYTVMDMFYYSTSFNVQIFNRWGAKVYETGDKQIQWKPKNISDGVYFMAILYTDCNNEQQKLAQTITVTTK